MTVQRGDYTDLSCLLTMNTTTAETIARDESEIKRVEIATTILKIFLTGSLKVDYGSIRLYHLTCVSLE